MSIPYDRNNSTNPYLINTNKDRFIVDAAGHSLSADYIWSKYGKDRIRLVQYVFNYYRVKGFPYPKYSNDQLKKSLEKIKKIDVDSLFVNGLLKNSNSSGTDIVKHFCGHLFYNSKVNNGLSPVEVFNNDELFLKVLHNRMGWNISKEDGTERPYVFGINDEMIIQGIRSSGLGSSISQFKPAVAKFIYAKHVPKNGVVLDYSAGWGARLLGAMSLDLTYYGIDPLTSKPNNNILKFFKGKGKVVNGVSEDLDAYKDFEKVDLSCSSPSYFNLEQYSDDKTQSYNKYNDYNEWLNKYWDITVKNCLSITKKGGYFSFVAAEMVKKYNLGKDMLKVCENNKLKIVTSYTLKTSQSHLSGKKKTGKIVKNTEIVYVLR